MFCNWFIVLGSASYEWKLQFCFFFSYTKFSSKYCDTLTWPNNIMRPNKNSPKEIFKRIRLL